MIDGRATVVESKRYCRIANKAHQNALYPMRREVLWGATIRVRPLKGRTLIAAHMPGLKTGRPIQFLIAHGGLINQTAITVQAI